MTLFSLTTGSKKVFLVPLEREWSLLSFYGERLTRTQPISRTKMQSWEWYGCVAKSYSYLRHQLDFSRLSAELSNGHFGTFFIQFSTWIGYRSMRLFLLYFSALFLLNFDRWWNRVKVNFGNLCLLEVFYNFFTVRPLRPFKTAVLRSEAKRKSKRCLEWLIIVKFRKNFNFFCFKTQICIKGWLVKASELFSSKLTEKDRTIGRRQIMWLVSGLFSTPPGR